MGSTRRFWLTPDPDKRVRRILLINQYFPPDTSATARVFEDLARALARAGHDVTVLSGRPSYAPTRRLTWRPLRIEHLSDSVRVIRLGTAAFDRGRTPARIWNYVSFIGLAAIAGMFLRKRDVVVCGTDPPLAILAAFVSARRRPLAYSVQDLHPDAVQASGMVRSKRLVAAWERVHRWALKRSTHVVCLGSDVAERIQAKGVSAAALSVIRTGSERPTGSPDPDVVSQLRSGAGFVVVHAGNLGTAGPWEEIGEAAATLSDIRFLFVGDGVFADDLRHRGLEVRPFLPAAALPSVMAAGDLQIVALKEGMVGSVVPSKLYTALGHGRPVLGIVPSGSEVARIIREWDCGVVVEPDRSAIVSSVASLAADPTRLAELQGNARRAAKVLSKDNSLDAWVSLVERLT